VKPLLAVFDFYDVNSGLLDNIIEGYVVGALRRQRRPTSSRTLGATHTSTNRYLRPPTIVGVVRPVVIDLDAEGRSAARDGERPRDTRSGHASRWTIGGQNPGEIGRILGQSGSSLTCRLERFAGKRPP
jgi:hypothetical protein